MLNSPPAVQRSVLTQRCIGPYFIGSWCRTLSLTTDWLALSDAGLLAAMQRFAEGVGRGGRDSNKTRCTQIMEQVLHYPIPKLEDRCQN